MKGWMNITMILIIIGTVLLSGCMTQTEQEKTLERNKIDPVSGGVAGSGVIEKETSDDTFKEVSEEIGYIGIDYLTGDVPTVIVIPGSYREELKDFQILNLKYEDRKIKFCVKDLIRTHTGTEKFNIEIRMDSSDI